jgi:hypothetical protein
MARLGARVWFRAASAAARIAARDFDLGLGNRRGGDKVKGSQQQQHSFFQHGPVLLVIWFV